MHISVQSRECGRELLPRLPGSSLFPERPVGAAIVDALRRPNGSVVCVTAPAMVDEQAQVDYYVRLGLATSARVSDPAGIGDAITMVWIDDRSERWLSEKLLDPDNPQAAAARAQLAAAVARERQAGRAVRLAYFEPSPLLEQLAQWLGVEGDQIPARYLPLGTKAAGRDLFRRLGIPIAAGTPLVHDLRELVVVLARMARDGHRRFVLKLDSTTYAAGMGNALLDLDGIGSAGLVAAIAGHLSTARPVDPQFRWSEFTAAIPEAGVLAEELLTGDEVRSPSFQGRLTDTGPKPVSTHEQTLAADHQTYTGCSFPASERYRATLTEHGVRVGMALHELGVDRGDYGVDFIAVRRDQTWWLYACELNLRATGTRHCFDIVCGLLDTTPDPDGELRVAGQRRTYVATDNLVAPHYVGLRPRTLIAAVERSPLHYDPARHRGVVLHMLSALPEFGKFGAVCVAESTAAATRLMDELRGLTDSLTRHSLRT